METTTHTYQPGTTHDLTVSFDESGPETGAAVTVFDTHGNSYWLIGARGGPDPMMLGSETHYDLNDVYLHDPTPMEPRSVQDAGNRDTPCPECGVQLQVESTPDDPPADIIGDIESLPTAQPVLILTEESTVTETGQIDDWVAHDAQLSGQHRRDGPSISYVCPHCGHETQHPPIPNAPLEQLVHNEVASPDMSESLGLAAGGGNDVNNFRDNIREGLVPQPSALTYEGLFYDYYFETTHGDPSREEGVNAVFTPTYSGALTTHPITGEQERYLSVGLDSSLTVEDFERKQLNLVAVLDISGSMSSPFDQYYYDQHGVRREVDEQSSETKMRAAANALCSLTEQLASADRLGIVLYNSTAQVAKPMRQVGDTDMHAIRRHIREVQAGGGTNLDAGIRAARELLAPFEGDDPNTVENRIVFMTDAMPNTGVTGQSDLVSSVEQAAADGVHTTFVGMGIDANAELVEALSSVRGANHYFVHSAAEFERRLGEEFEYMVTPLVYDLSLTLETDGYEIEGVYGSPNADTATGEVMHVSTLFPSPTEDGETRGGIILIKLTSADPDGSVELSAAWTERDGTTHTERVSASLPTEPETFGHDGVRKAVALTRYAETLRAWAGRIHGTSTTVESGVDDWQRQHSHGEHERGSIPLSVSPEFVDQFEQLTRYLESEREALNDETLDDEVAILNRLRKT